MGTGIKRHRDITGQRFGRLTAIRCLGPKPGLKSRCAYWEVQCDCGNVRIHRIGVLTKGVVHSCGCFRKEITGAKFTTHGHAKGRQLTPEYRAWLSMRVRCYRPTYEHYADYGGRGITVCDQWVDSFVTFYAHIGPKPSPEMSLDRIDNDGNYEPGNVRWATKAQQRRNQRCSR
jgi:hypothetical protein